MGRHRAEAQDRARRADDAIEARLHDLARVLLDLAVDELHHLALVARRERIRGDEPFGEPNDAHLEAAAKPHRFGVAERDLDAAAADVDDDRRPAHHVDAVDRGEVDEPRLLGA